MTPAEILTARQKLHMTQVEFARALMVDVMTVSRWERGERTPPPYLVLAIQHLSCKPPSRP